MQYNIHSLRTLQLYVNTYKAASVVMAYRYRAISSKINICPITIVHSSNVYANF